MESGLPLRNMKGHPRHEQQQQQQHHRKSSGAHSLQSIPPSNHYHYPYGNNTIVKQPSTTTLRERIMKWTIILLVLSFCIPPEHQIIRRQIYFLFTFGGAGANNIGQALTDEQVLNTPEGFPSQVGVPLSKNNDNDNNNNNVPLGEGEQEDIVVLETQPPEPWEADPAAYHRESVQTVLAVAKQQAKLPQQSPPTATSTATATATDENANATETNTSAKTNAKATPTTVQRVEETFQKSGFALFRTPSEFFLQMAYALNKKSNDGSFHFRDQDLFIVVRSTMAMFSFTNQGMWSGTSARHHFLGTGSCMLRIGRTASEIAIGVMHGLYVQRWRNEMLENAANDCDFRYHLREVLGSELETELWVGSGLHGTGPWHNCLKTYNSLKVAYDKGNLDKNTQDMLKRYFDDVPVAMLLCDEVEEAIGGDEILGGHWKRRTKEFFETARESARLFGMGDTVLMEYLDHAEVMSHLIHTDSPPQDAFKELTPPQVAMLFNGTTHPLNTKLPVEDRQRWVTLMDLMLNDRPMTNRYLAPGQSENITVGVWGAREICDSFHEDDITIKGYLKRYFALRNELTYCENTDPRFQVPMPMPEIPPNSAIVRPMWDIFDGKP